MMCCITNRLDGGFSSYDGVWKGSLWTATISTKTQIADTTISAVLDRKRVRGLMDLTWGLPSFNEALFDPNQRACVYFPTYPIGNCS